MATHSSVLAWRIPGMGEPGGLPSMGVAQSQTRLKRPSSSSYRDLMQVAWIWVSGLTGISPKLILVYHLKRILRPLCGEEEVREPGRL